MPWRAPAMLAPPFKQHDLEYEISYDISTRQQFLCAHHGLGDPEEAGGVGAAFQVHVGYYFVDKSMHISRLLCARAPWPRRP